jgi:hypothetical protein
MDLSHIIWNYKMISSGNEQKDQTSIDFSQPTSQPTKETVLDIHVYIKEHDINGKKKNVIEIRFDILGIDINLRDSLPENLYEKFENHTRNNNDYRNADLTQIILNTEKKNKNFPHSHVTGMKIADGSSHLYENYSITYYLPTEPHQILNWFACFSHYINHVKRTDCIHLKKYSPFSIEDETGQQNSLSMKDYANKKNLSNGIVLALLDSLIALKPESEADPYYDAICAIEKITGVYREGRSKRKPFIYFIQTEKRFELLMPEIKSKLFNIATNHKQKTTLLVDLCRQLISKNQQADISFVIKSLNYLARKKLFALCLGQRAHNKGIYTDNYTEWYFLQNAEFRLDKIDNETVLSIVNLTDNPGYNHYYAKGKQNHNIFQPEMEFLADVWKMSYLPGCDFHHKITFSAASTKKLLSFGVHQSLEKIQKQLYKENFWNFFSRSKINGCDIFLMSTPTSPTTEFLISNKNYLYLYMSDDNNQNNQIFYRIKDIEEKQYLENVDEFAIQAIITEGFHQPADKPAKYENEKVCDAILSITSKKDHTEINKHETNILHLRPETLNIIQKHRR